MTDSVYPAADWQRAGPEDVGLDEGRLEAARLAWINRAGDRPYRVAVVRRGRLVAQWCQGVEPTEHVALASAAKSIFSSMLGIAVAEGMIASADDKVVDYYPEMMDVPEGQGPKPGRFAREKDRDITFRHLISNTSGYLKPDEKPGEVFHYQTFGMNVLCHAIATRYGYYDTRDPDRLLGFCALASEKIGVPIGAKWTWKIGNFEHAPGARVNIFGNYNNIHATVLDMARLGLLWLRRGRWGDRQVVPEEWVTEATRVAATIREHESEERWAYGLGFWSNQFGRQWPNLPTDSFAARGAGRQLIWVWPAEDLVVVESPGLFEKPGQENLDLLPDIVGAVKS